MNDRFAVAVIAIALAAGGLWAQTAPAKVDNSTIVGAWQLEVDAGETYYYLNLNVLENSGKLEGTISEVNGFFKDVPLAEVAFDGAKLTFKFNSPTPPDGVTREVDVEVKLLDDVLDGAVRVPELTASAHVTGTRAASRKD